MALKIRKFCKARCYLTFVNFQYQNYLNVLNILKYRKSLSRLRLCSHRLEVEVGQWAKPNKIPYKTDQSTNGPVNAHLISGPSIITNIQNPDKVAEQTLTLINNNSLINSFSLLYQHDSRSQDAIMSKESIIVTFSHIKA